MDRDKEKPNGREEHPDPPDDDGPESDPYPTGEGIDPGDDQRVDPGVDQRVGRGDEDKEG
jgi:hypothetical protein